MVASLTCSLNSAKKTSNSSSWLQPIRPSSTCTPKRINTPARSREYRHGCTVQRINPNFIRMELSWSFQILGPCLSPMMHTVFASAEASSLLVWLIYIQGTKAIHSNSQEISSFLESGLHPESIRKDRSLLTSSVQQARWVRWVRAGYTFTLHIHLCNYYRTLRDASSAQSTKHNYVELTNTLWKPTLLLHIVVLLSLSGHTASSLFYMSLIRMTLIIYTKYTRKILQLHPLHLLVG
jgi:hypothetical protein